MPSATPFNASDQYTGYAKTPPGPGPGEVLLAFSVIGLGPNLAAGSKSLPGVLSCFENATATVDATRSSTRKSRNKRDAATPEIYKRKCQSCIGTQSLDLGNTTRTSVKRLVVGRQGGQFLGRGLAQHKRLRRADRIRVAVQIL